MGEELHIIKQRDEYPISIEISNENAKGEVRLTVKARFDTDKMSENELKSAVATTRRVYLEESAKLLKGETS